MTTKPCDDLPGTCRDYPACQCGRAWREHDNQKRLEEARAGGAQAAAQGPAWEKDVVTRLQDRIAEHYRGNSLEAGLEPIATLLAAIDEIERLRSIAAAPK